MNYSTLYCGDCVPLLRRLANDSVDLCVTSCPYDKLRSYNGYAFDFESVAQELFTVTKPGGMVCWIVGDGVQGGGETGTSFRQALFFQSLGFSIHDTMIYQKRNFSHPEKRRYHQVFEYVFCLSKGPPSTFNPIKDRKNITAGAVGNLGVNTYTERDGSKSVRAKKVVAEYGMRHNVWLGNSRGQEEMCASLKHPAMMPKWLARDLILSWSNPNDVVLEPFGGSGTVVAEADKLNRRWIYMDISMEYFKRARDYLKTSVNQDFDIQPNPI